MKAPSIDEAYAAADVQYQHSGLYIGKRGTPVISYWPMKEKWKKFGKWFTYIGTDGDTEIIPGVGAREPAMLQLFYVALTPEWVVQLAWVRDDLNLMSDRIIYSEALDPIRLWSRG